MDKTHKIGESQIICTNKMTKMPHIKYNGKMNYREVLENSKHSWKYKIILFKPAWEIGVHAQQSTSKIWNSPIGTASGCFIFFIVSPVNEIILEEVNCWDYRALFRKILWMIRAAVCEKKVGVFLIFVDLCTTLPEEKWMWNLI